jgi:PPOX class probable F420-dependent enzyme
LFELTDTVAQRLNDEVVIWLTTVRADGTPQPSLVWFWWDGEEFLIYSRPAVPKLANIAANPRVALNLNSIGDGGVAIFSGEARLDPTAPPSHLHAEYLPKYRRLI